MTENESFSREKTKEEKAEKEAKATSDKQNDIAIIRNFIVNHYAKNGIYKKLRNIDIANGTGLSLSTIYRLKEEVDFSGIVASSDARLLVDDVIMGIANAATKGRVDAAKLYFQLLFGWKEEQAFDVRMSEPIQVIWGNDDSEKNDTEK